MSNQSQDSGSIQPKRRVSIRTRALQCHKKMVENLSPKSDKDVVQTHFNDDEIEASVYDCILKYLYRGYYGSKASNKSFPPMNDHHFFHLHHEMNGELHEMCGHVLKHIVRIKPSDLDQLSKSDLGGDDVITVEEEEEKGVFTLDNIMSEVAKIFTQKGLKIGDSDSQKNNFVDAYSAQGERNSMEDRMNFVLNANKLYGLADSASADRLSYFGVYDGHSGAAASEFTRTNLHVNFFKYLRDNVKGGIVNEDVLSKALSKAYITTDEQFKVFAEDYVLHSGSTALSVIMLEKASSMEKYIMAAYVGDTQAFLFRHSYNDIISLCVPHKADRKDEKERIEKAGGKVYYFFGQARVNGVLAITRSIGDPKLKKFIIGTPDLSAMYKVEKNDILIMASDGLWDVFSSQDAINFVRSYIGNNSCIEGCSAELVRCAMDKKSKDNISVMIVIF